MNGDLVVCRADWERDPDGEILRRCLAAHFATELAHERARVMVRLWLAAGALVWLAAVSPSFPPAAWRAPILVAWAILAVAALGFSVVERYWLGRLEDRLAKLEPGDRERPE